jgi:hypothetical protein
MSSSNPRPVELFMILGCPISRTQFAREVGKFVAVELQVVPGKSETCLKQMLEI